MARIHTKNEAMIYLLEENNFPMSEDKVYLFDVPEGSDPLSVYRHQMLKLAEEIGAVINPEHFYIEDHHPHHSNLSHADYWNLVGKWVIRRTQNSLLDFMRKNFTEINYVRM